MLITLAFAAVLSQSSIPLPGGAPVGMDYLVYEPAHHRVWAPAGNTGNVDVVETATGKVTPIGGFATKASTRPNRPNVGPSSATLGDGVVWIGNRGDSTLCAFDAATLEKRRCVQLDGMPDGLTYVAATREVWATTPGDQAISIVDVGDGGVATVATIKVPGSPEGYAVDPIRGVFYTNLKDKDQTLAIDVKTRKVIATWPTGCGKEGPRGISLDGARSLLMVACTDGAVALDLAHGGKPLGRLKTGEGVDEPDYSVARKLLYLASGKSGTLTIARVADDGSFTAVATLPTAKGARNGVVDDQGKAFVADSAGGRLIAVDLPTLPAR